MIEQTGKYKKFIVFAEAGTSNGTGLINFKKGAFFAEKAVEPMYMKYQWTTFNPAYETMEFLPHAIMHLSWCFARCNVRIMPPFQPNEYLFEKHTDKGKERWEIYAWAVRDAMMKAGKFEPIDLSLKIKMQYERYMWGLPGVMIPDLADYFTKNQLLNASSGSTSSKENSNYLLDGDSSPDLFRQLDDTPMTTESSLDGN